ncbi:MAG: YkgJ family cysteine cluster protein [Nitrospirae bacterium]|nr:YkgJ family cysteine cluster protein [Nitrospirota bacterium]
MIDNLFSRYELEARKADYLFKTIQEKYPMSVRCRIRCCDCCYAVFGVFPIEAAYINYHFNHLERKIKRDVLRKAEKADIEILKVRDKLRNTFNDKPEVQIYGLGKHRIMCPFLTEKDECILYEKRPIICRIYGVPYSLNDGKKEKSYVCGISGFDTNVSYSTVKLYKIYGQLYKFSEELLSKGGTPIAKLNKAKLMLPLSRIIRMSIDEIIQGNFEEY